MALFLGRSRVLCKVLRKFTAVAPPAEKTAVCGARACLSRQGWPGERKRSDTKGRVRGLLLCGLAETPEHESDRSTCALAQPQESWYTS